MKKKPAKKDRDEETKALENQAALEQVIRKHLTKYKTKILNKPLIDQIRKEVAQILLEIKVPAKIKKKMLDSVTSTLNERHEELVKYAQDLLEKKRAEEAEKTN